MASQESSLAASHPAGYPAVVIAGGAAALKLFIPGRVPGWDDDPISKGRPRSRVQVVKDVAARLAQLGGRLSPRDLPKLVYAQIYTDPRTREWEEWVERCARSQVLELGRIDDGQQLTLPLTGRVLVTLRFNLTRPKSVPKSVTVPLTARGDVDNMSKSVIDGIQNAKVIANDRLITDAYGYRRYADELHPVGVEVDLTGLR